MPDQQLSDLSVTKAPTEEGPVSRDPDAIQREIEETRAELARTVDLIAERLSPRRAASRGASRVKSSIDGVFHRDGDDGHDTAPGAADHAHGIRSVPLSPNGDTQLVRTLRTDRVVVAAAAVAAVIGAIVFLRRRRH
ncbi:MAG: hypothetical protein QOG53_1270 [Frankiales bacterium]|nr:hypothetical protein [Frankiales bacterium]